MTPDGDQLLRERIRGELSGLPVPPPPVSAITRRGQAKRSARRWAFTGCVAAVAVTVAVAELLGAGAARPSHTVSISSPDPRAPGGVFAAGTANGKPWRLAVRNVAGLNGSCLPAIMLNGRDGDLLFRAGPRSPAIGKPGFLTQAPGFGGIEFVVAQVSLPVTSAVLDFGSSRLATTPVTVRACGQRFRLAGWAFSTARRQLSAIDTYSPRFGLEEGLFISQSDQVPPSQGPYSAGLWQNLDTSPGDTATSLHPATIGSGAAGNASWKIKVSLGLYGECYTGTTTSSFGPGAAQMCQPVEAPPPDGMSLAPVPFPADTTAQLSGWAGPVSPRTARALVRLSDGTTKILTPVAVRGRKYLALTVTGQVRLARITLLDATGHVFATSSPVPATK